MKRLRLAGFKRPLTVLSWLWFIGGFVVTELSGRTPRSKRTCWGSGGHSFDAERLESLRASLPATIVAHMPPDAGSWLIRIDNVIQTSIEAVEYIANIRPATESAGPTSHSSGNEVRRPKMEGMAGERQQQIVDLWNELKMAYDKAIQRFPNRLEDIETVFSVTNAMRASLIELDGIATQTAEYGEYSIELVDRLHTAIWKDRELFDSLSDQKRALFTWRETSIEWRGRQASNILEAIRNEAFQYGVDLQECSLHKTFAPSKQMRALYPERWFDVAGVAKVARRIKDRIPLATTSPEKLAPTLESTFGQYFAHIRGYEAAKNHVKRCSSNVTGPALKDTLSAFYVIEAGRWRQDANREWNAAKALPNAGRVQALCEAEFGVLNSEGLRRLRGRLATVRQCGTEDIDSMTLNEFAESWQALIVTSGTAQNAIDARSVSSIPPEQAIVGFSLKEVVSDFASATEKVPDAYKEQGRECGPLEGGKTAIAKAVTGNPKAKPEDLKKHHGGKVFVRQVAKRKVEVFFRSFREFHAAKERLTSANSE